MRRCACWAKYAVGFVAALLLPALLSSVLATSVLAAASTAEPPAHPPIRVASKNFGESYLLSEIASQLLEARGFTVIRQFGLGGTLICYSALIEGEVDLYIEYSGTLAQAVLKSDTALSLSQIRAGLPTDLSFLAPFGFNNTYAMAVRQNMADELGLSTIGDLRAHPELKVVVSHEFLERNDGWPGLAQAYGLGIVPAGIEHGLAYQAIADGAIDVTDAYSTDGELIEYELALLADDREFFPEYLAAPLVRKELPAPARSALGELVNTLNARQMQALNAAVLAGSKSGEADFAAIASAFLQERGLVEGSVVVSPQERLWRDLWRNTLRHLELTLVALSLAIAVGVGVGVLVFRNASLARAVVYVCGLMQTIPSIALLALMIPLLGIGKTPAIVALFLYALLPILRNTVVALGTIDPELVRTAKAIGLSRGERLRHVLVPMALPNIFAGIRTAAVISVGTATLAAFIGAGGLGDPIVTGLSLNDTHLILQGAIPAACLAMLIELTFEGIERWVISRPLREAALGGG